MLFDLVKRNDLVSIIEASSYEEAAKMVLNQNNCTLKDTLEDSTSDDVREFYFTDSEGETDYLLTTYCYETALVEALTKLNYSLFEHEEENIIRPRF